MNIERTTKDARNEDYAKSVAYRLDDIERQPAAI